MPLPHDPPPAPPVRGEAPRTATIMRGRHADTD